MPPTTPLKAKANNSKSSVKTKDTKTTTKSTPIKKITVSSASGKELEEKKVEVEKGEAEVNINKGEKKIDEEKEPKEQIKSMELAEKVERVAPTTCAIVGDKLAQQRYQLKHAAEELATLISHYQTRHTPAMITSFCTSLVEDEDKTKKYVSVELLKDLAQSILFGALTTRLARYEEMKTRLEICFHHLLHNYKAFSVLPDFNTPIHNQIFYNEIKALFQKSWNVEELRSIVLPAIFGRDANDQSYDTEELIAHHVIHHSPYPSKERQDLIDAYIMGCDDTERTIFTFDVIKALKTIKEQQWPTYMRRMMFASWCIEFRNEMQLRAIEAEAVEAEKQRSVEATVEEDSDVDNSTFGGNNQNNESESESEKGGKVEGSGDETEDEEVHSQEGGKSESDEEQSESEGEWE